MYEGMFVLYRHTRLPYEVHAFFQKCGRAGSCTCGMVVKSGDYVFVAEMCRRRKTRCGRKRGGRCRNLLKAKSYVWDEVTPGTRLFKRTNGFEVSCSLIWHRALYTQYEGLNLANEKSRTLEIFDRKLEGNHYLFYSYFNNY